MRSLGAVSIAHCGRTQRTPSVVSLLAACLNLVNQTVKSVIYSVTSDSVHYIKMIRHILLVNRNSYNDNPTFRSLRHAFTLHNVLHIPQDSDDQESTH